MGDLIERGLNRFAQKRTNDLTEALINNGSLPFGGEFNDRNFAIRGITGIFESCHALKKCGSVTEEEAGKILDELVKRGLFKEKTGS